VETLFHEFGHALHSLLSRTTFQHLSGTRAATDFVETPSHLLEHFAWDPNFLPAFAKHYITKEVLSDEMIRLLVQSRQDFKSIELQNQLLYARFDQTLFGVPIRATSTEILSRLYQECNVPFAEGAHWHTRFGHLVTYGAGYYGYLYAQAFASDLWKEYLADHCLDSTSGRRLWHEMLKHGGAKDPQAMMRSLLGRDEPNVEALVDELSPILTAKDRRRQQEASTANNR
jgi:intermediate peptidase